MGDERGVSRRAAAGWTGGERLPAGIRVGALAEDFTKAVLRYTTPSDTQDACLPPTQRFAYAPSA
ncbi:hypothetical protein C7T35_01725 [Variovorax sp. WS11]|nr:hypothetical protein C7T35_01725 [Variovorax sp. WS11]